MFKASAPGSLMLLGEHAVLHGHLALVCAIDKRVTVELSPRPDSIIAISSALGEFKTTLSQLHIAAPFQFVLVTLKKFKNKMPSGCDIKISADFSHQVGFASSAAVTVATLGALNAWLTLSLTKMDWTRIARRIIRQVQGLGSGADVAASVWGGVVAYRAQPFTIEKLSAAFPLTVVYSGKKTPTPVVVNSVRDYFAKCPELFKSICRSIGKCAEEGRQAIKAQDWPTLGKIMTIQQGLMNALGVSTVELDEIVYNLSINSRILGAKISGSGLGDCLIGLGSIQSDSLQILPVQITNEGACCE